MATGRSPCKDLFENEDLLNEENKPDFDEDTLIGELGSTLASGFVSKNNFYSTSFKNVSRCGE